MSTGKCGPTLSIRCTGKCPSTSAPRALGDDFQQGVALAHHRALGMHPQVDGDAIGGGEDFAVLQLEAGGFQLLLQGFALELDIGQLAAHLFLVFLVMLLQLQARLDDPCSTRPLSPLFCASSRCTCDSWR